MRLTAEQGRTALRRYNMFMLYRRVGIKRTFASSILVIPIHRGLRGTRGPASYPGAGAPTRCMLHSYALAARAAHALRRTLAAGAPTLLLALLLPWAAQAQAPTVTVTPAGPLTLCAGSTQTLTAMATVPGFNVAGSGFDGSVRAVVVQPDGKVLVGGEFTSYNGSAAAPDYVLRLNADGSLDPTFNPSGAGANGYVYALAEQPDGKVLVGGGFTTYNGSAAAPDNLLRLNANGTLDTGFNNGGAGADNAVLAVAVQADGKVLVGGGFAAYNGNAAAPDRVLRLNANGSLDTSFNNGGTGANNNYVWTIGVQADGKVLVGGEFTTYNGSAAAPDNLLRLNANGTLDNTFNSGGTGASDIVYTLAMQPNGQVLVGGLFRSYNGAAAPDFILRLNANGTLDTGFNTSGAGTDNTVSALAVQPDGKVLVGGNISAYNGNAAVPDDLLRLNPDGSLDPSFNNGGAGVDGIFVQAVAVQADGKVVVGGNFTAYNGSAAPDYLLRLNPDGSLNNAPTVPAGLAYTWSNGATGPSITVSQPGDYQATATTTANGTGYSNVVRVNAPAPVTVNVTPAGPLALPAGGSATLTATATLAAFNAAGSGIDGVAYALAVQPDGKVLVGGNFSSYNDNAAAPNDLLRLNADGTLDNTFNPGGVGTDFQVYALAVQPDGKILVGGLLTTYNGNAAVPDNVLRLNADGTLDNTFNPGGSGGNGLVTTLVVQPDGKILVAGSVTTYNGSDAPDRVLRLNANGSLDTSFNSGRIGIDARVSALALQADGKILVGGTFTSYNGLTAVSDGLLRLHADGSLDASFNPGGTGTSSVYALALQADGKILVGGSFSAYNGNAAAPDNLLRLNVNGLLDTSFNPGGGGSNGLVEELAVQADGQVLVGGSFTTYNGSAAPRKVLRVNSGGTLDNTFNPGGTGADDYVAAFALLADGKILVGGLFTAYNGNAAAPDGILRLNADGSLNNAATPLAGATFVFNPGGTAGPTRTVSTAGTYTATATDPATGCTYQSNAVVVTVPAAPADLTISTGTLASPVAVPAGTYGTITVTSTGVAQFTGAVAVNTAVVVSGALLTNCQPLTGSADFTLAAGATLGICDPNGLYSTGASGAVQVMGTRSFSPDATYVYNGTQAQSTGPGLPATVRALTVANPVVLGLTQAVTIAQTLTLAGTGNLQLNFHTLLLRSDATGTALIANLGTGVVVGSTGIMQRHIETNTAANGYRHYASPMAAVAGAETLATLATAGYTPDFSGAAAYNSSATPSLVTPFPTVFLYNQDRITGTVSDYASFDKGWQAALGSEVPQAGRGYTVQAPGAALVDFTGTFTSGAVSRSNLQRASADPTTGWHLLGNPYPSPLDWSTMSVGTTAADNLQNVDGAVYVFESSGPYAGSYRTYLATAPGQGSPLIPAGSGFFVHATTPTTPGTVRFGDANRVTTFGPQPAFGRNTDLRPRLTLELRGAGGLDAVTVYADPVATPSIDATHDALKLPNPTGLNLSAQAGPDYLAIDGLPAFTGGTVVPLAVGVPTAGPYALQVSQLLKLPAGTAVVLVDTELNTRTDLATLPAAGYAFTVTAPQATALLTTRFYLSLSVAGPLAAVAGRATAALQLYPNPAPDGTATLTGALPGAAVTVYDALGRPVLTATADASGTTRLTLPSGLPAGVYLVRAGGQTLRLLVE